MFGLARLRDLPDLEGLEDAGLLSKDMLLAEEISTSGSDDKEGDAERDDFSLDDWNSAGGTDGVTNWTRKSLPREARSWLLPLASAQHRQRQKAAAAQLRIKRLVEAVADKVRSEHEEG